MLAELRALAAKNQVCESFIGMGYSDCITPPVIQRNILENPGWYTAYTPYQAEIAQGRLEALLNFQTMVADLTGLPIANASLLDEATAAAEAMHMLHACAVARRRRARRHVLRLRRLPPADDRRGAHARRAARHRRASSATRRRSTSRRATCSACWCSIRRPTARVLDYRDRRASARTTAGALVAMATDLLALDAARRRRASSAPTSRSAARSASACRWATAARTRRSSRRSDEFERKLPGRIIGVSEDAHGTRRLRMALQTREQHIRREKATSNICTAQVLLAVIAGMYAVYHGPEGLRAIAERVAPAGGDAGARGSSKLGVRVAHRRFFDTVRVDGSAGDVDGLAGGRRGARHQPAPAVDDGASAIALDETTTAADVDELLDGLRAAARRRADAGDARAATVDARSGERSRARAPFLTHPVFNTHHSETEMLRYMRRLEATRPVADALDDPARLVHDEAERDGRDDAGHLARVRAAAPVRAGRAGARATASCSRSLESDARRDHRLRRRCRCSRTPARRASTRACS